MSLPRIGGGIGGLYGKAGGSNNLSASSAYCFNDKTQSSPPIIVCVESPNSPPNNFLNNFQQGTNQFVNALVHLGAGALGLLTAIFLSHKLKPKVEPIRI